MTAYEQAIQRYVGMSLADLRRDAVGRRNSIRGHASMDKRQLITALAEMDVAEAGEFEDQPAKKAPRDLDWSDVVRDGERAASEDFRPIIGHRTFDFYSARKAEAGRDAQEEEAARLAKRDAAFKILTTLSAAQDGPEDRRIAWDRAETDACQRGTVGCCIDHDDDTDCQTW